MNNENKIAIDSILNKLKARSFLIQANIMFGKDFLENNLNDDPKVFEVSKLIEQQTNYNKEVQSLAKFISDRCSKKNSTDQETLEFNNKSKALLGDSRNNLLIKKLHELSQNYNEIDIDRDINDTMTDLINIKDKASNEKINLVVIGRRGAGKSSFINEFFNKHNYDKNAVPTNEVECTLNPEIYDYKYFKIDSTLENEQYNKLRVWDFPGAGTDKFPLDEYKEMIKYLPVFP